MDPSDSLMIISTLAAHPALADEYSFRPQYRVSLQTLNNR
jgi:hypothetical protein